jgi:hypothetical protein
VTKYFCGKCLKECKRSELQRVSVYSDRRSSDDIHFEFFLPYSFEQKDDEMCEDCFKELMTKIKEIK